MTSCVIFGGAGFIGTHLTRHFLANKRFQRVHIADIRPTVLEGVPGISYSHTDVRELIPADLVSDSPEWIFNLAAIHREPGHEPHEYFDTNLPGARNVCAYAEAVDCRNVYFTSSISVYGPTSGPTRETSPLRPTTPYGGSKLPAELIHESWRRAGQGRRLMVSRPGVVYGPGDPGNIMRMIRAIKKGYFAYPGQPDIMKSYAYIYGFINSVDFVMARDDAQITYNYVETPTEPLANLVTTVKAFLDCKALVLPLPLGVLVPVARMIQMVLGSRNPIHPVRVRKAATSTHIIPQTLLDLGFEFKYDFAKSLEHWRRVSPADFDFSEAIPPECKRLTLIRKVEDGCQLERTSPRPETSAALCDDD